MKYLVTLVIGAFAGMVGAWMLFTASTQTPPSFDPVQTYGRIDPRVQNSAPARDRAGQPLTSPEFKFEDIAQRSTVFAQQLVAWQLAANAGIEDLEHWIDLCLNESDPLYRQNIAGVFLERYVEIDPPAAMDYVRSEYRFNQDAMQSHVLTSWVRYDPEAALDYFRNIPDLRLRSIIGMQLMQDPVLSRTGMIGEVESILGPSASTIQKQIELQQADPAALFESALGMNGVERQTRMAYAINRWVPVDPEAALNRIASLESGETRNVLMQMAIGRYAQRDPEGALAYTRLHDPENIQLQAQVISIMAQYDIEKAIPIAEAFDRESKDTSALNSVISTWAQSDPAAALAYVETLDSTRRNALYGNIVYQYSRDYPQQALNWILDLGPEYAQIKRAGLQMIARQDVDLAVGALPHVEGESRQALISSIAEEKSKMDPDSALAWLSGFQRESAYPNAFATIVSHVAQVSPERAAALIDNTNEKFEGALSIVAHHWYQKDPDQAIEWVQSLPSGPNRNHIIASVSMMVSGNDPGRAIALISDLPQTEKEQAARAMAYNWARGQPEEIENLIARLDLSDSIIKELRQITANPSGPGLR